ncbi:M28 family metallopeptidase [Phenylobacterium immobile]|uniref:M28 family metallopeptidase n=1 Tax=Phenylobacterium immobile TaxID=21 RepID=UPI000B0877C6|nr:M28 family metallopeptidase [Phenylobacterium immobile]
MKKILAGAAIFSLLAGAAGADPRLDETRLAQHIRILSADDFEGRGPATPAEAKTVDYLVKALSQAGAQPGGSPLPSGGRGWTQDVPLARFEIKGPVAVSAKVGPETLTWAQGDQVALRAPQTNIDHLTVKDAPLVFLGYGVKAPERSWDDFKGVDLKGKIGLVLVNDPDFETGEGDFGGKAMTYYGRWTYKYEEAARQGALGLLVIHETAPAAYGWATVKNSNTISIFDIIRDDPTKAHPPLEGWIQRDATIDLFKRAGLDFEALKAVARTRDFKPVALNGVSLSADFAVDAQKVISKNVAAVVTGAKRPDEYVVYTAHWDHLGVGPADAKGDTIYNGAVDNAAGVSGLIELARAFAKGPKPERSVLFLAVTAEEKGLLGSEYYADNPLYPLGKTVADINMDGAGVNGPARDISTSGDAPLTLQDDLIALAKSRGRSFTPDARPEAGSFYRSDHFPLAKRGLPAISFKSGQDLESGGVAAGKAAADAYTRDRYHQPADEFNPAWKFDGMSNDLGLLLDLGQQLANSRAWPEWKAGSEFKAVRDQSAAMRQ